MDSEYISLNCLALRLALPRTYLRRLLNEGKLPFIDMGNGRKRFQEKAVRETLKAIETGGSQALFTQLCKAEQQKHYPQFAETFLRLLQLGIIVKFVGAVE